MAEPDYDAEMRLPPGETCDGCIHAKRCFGFGFSSPGRTTCDFHPSRFAAAASQAVVLVGHSLADIVGGPTDV